MLLEGDSLHVISELKKVGPLESSRGQLINDTKLILFSLGHCGFQHVRREANMKAHCMAKFALYHLINRVWIGVCSSVIQNIVIAEQNEISP